ncbi:MAG: Dan4p [Parcubacteria group bacterium GW2011_GWC1_39_8]|nr:MAG: Dan4p [Parcubacteria group bacterium GW2011_GWC1_39_8]
MNQFSKRLMAFSLILMLGLTPALSYANNSNESENNRNNKHQKVERENEDHDDEDEHGRENKHKKDKSEKNANKLCRKAFNNLFKYKGFGSNSTDFFIECLRPFGFEARFTGTTSSTTPDTKAPVIYNLSITPATTTATITWLTDEKSDGTVFWSTSTGINTTSSSTASITNSHNTKNHRMVLENLTASTTYFVIVRSKDKASNTATSTETSFKTHSPVVNIDNTPPVVSNISTEVGTSTIKVSWQTNEPATSKLFYSTSTNPDVTASSTSFIANFALVLNHLISLTDLLPQTIYYLVIQSVDGHGNSTTSSSFATTTNSI